MYLASSMLGGPVSSLLGNGGGDGHCRAHLSLEILASRRKQGDGCSAVTRPASLFVKRSPVPARRPLGYIPLSSISNNNPEGDEEEEEEEEEEEDLLEKEEIDGGRLAKAKKPEPVQVRKKSDRVSKWASLFEAANGSSSSSTATAETNNNTDAWFDKIFPKNPAGGASSPPSSSKLSAQQEKSIQQLQSLVKTLGVATKNPPPPARKNKPSKIRQLPVEGGGVVDPVPFASILKKLQSVSSPKPEQRSRLGQELERSTKVVEELGSEEEGSETSESGGSTARIEEESSEEEGVFSRKSAVEEINDLAKLTVPTLRGMAKSRGLSGYSRLKKDDLVHLLTSSDK
ncbi:rho-N domain-containing protein 1, chloroplastic [Selaginella moellendorffii]|uniref:rho-N domain-containing protein 1, chloroplastic n=1 Tax=Selaginella moellendorffii TaxID=88036 RepID=UPI000D1CA70E|nr:rho-N domain-containing protein 1, chloroplastic [Selaginella moellendorffii]|eukprot:XP_024543574.1 rho-N domain-containing protein 1, chloroplastic [Selaginella moellendorffii]